MKKYLFITTISALFILQSCKKEDVAAIVDPGNNNNSSNSALSSVFGGFPIPTTINAPGGVIGAASVTIGSGLLAVETKIGFASFVKSGTTNQFVYGGDLKIGSTSIDTINTSAGPIYLMPNSKNPLASLGLSFGGSTNTVITVAGDATGGVAAFTDESSFPERSSLTAPTNLSNVPRNANLALAWDATGGSDSIMVFAVDGGGKIATKLGIANTGSATIPSSDLSGFQTGTGTVMLIKYRYHLKNGGGKVYGVIGQTVNTVVVTWQ